MHYFGDFPPNIAISKLHVLTIMSLSMHRMNPIHQYDHPPINKVLLVQSNTIFLLTITEMIL